MITDKNKRFLTSYGDAKATREIYQNDKSYYVRSRITDNPFTPVDVLDKLIEDPVNFIREGVAKHPNAAKEHLNKLVDDQDDDVRESAYRALKERFPK